MALEDRNARRGTPLRVLTRALVAGSLTGFLAAGTCHASFCSGSECNHEEEDSSQAARYEPAAFTRWHPLCGPHSLLPFVGLHLPRATPTR